MAPPNLGPMVSMPLATEEIKSLPALAATIALCAPETAGPWSAVTIIAISMNLVAYGGKLAFEPQNAQYSADSYVFFEHFGNRHLAVEQFFASVV